MVSGRYYVPVYLIFEALRGLPPLLCHCPVKIPRWSCLLGSAVQVEKGGLLLDQGGSPSLAPLYLAASQWPAAWFSVFTLGPLGFFSEITTMS